MRHAGSQALAKSSIRQSISVFLLFLICSLFALKINSLLISLSQTPCQIPFSIPNQKKKKKHPSTCKRRAMKLLIKDNRKASYKFALANS